MHIITHGSQLNLKEIVSSKDYIFCILEKGKSSSKLRYCTKEKINNKLILKSIITEDEYNEKDLENHVLVYKVTKDNMIRYIENNIEFNEEEVKNITELFINTYKEFE